MTTSTPAPTPPDSQGVINVRRVSLHAYNTAVHAARDAAGPAPRLDADHEAWAELEDADLAQDGSLRPQWAHALGAAPDAPVQINLVARQDNVTFTTDVVLLPGLGLATTRRSVTEPESDASEAFEPAVELVAFAPEEIWPAIRRALPPQEAMRADPHPTPTAERNILPAPQVLHPRSSTFPREINDLSGGLGGG